MFISPCSWVFFSSAAFGANVMVSVAKNFDAPIKMSAISYLGLLVPLLTTSRRGSVWPKELGGSAGFTLLGLGDIVLPG